MTEVTITRKGFKCERCDHSWLPTQKYQGKTPIICPHCKSPYWNKERKNAKKT